MSFDEMSLSGGDDAVVSGIDEYVCGVNSVSASGVLDRRDGDTVLSGVDEKLRWWLDHEWFNLVGWTGSSAQTVPCGPSYHRCTQYV